MIIFCIFCEVINHIMIWWECKWPAEPIVLLCLIHVLGFVACPGKRILKKKVSSHASLPYARVAMQEVGYCQEERPDKHEVSS